MIDILHPLVILTIFATIVSSDYLNDLCDKSNNFTSNSTYAANLKQLHTSLLSSIIPSGFTNTTVGQNPNQVFGLASCRGDVSAENCQSCLETAFNETSTRCPYGKTEIIWYDYCLLHYSNINFFSKIAPWTFEFHWCSLHNTTDPQRFATILGQLMSTVISQAASSPKMFAAGFANFTSLNRIYALAQCTRDISNDECHQCLRGSMENIPIFCDHANGGLFYGQNCNMRFESTIFYNTSAVPNVAVAAPPPPADTTNKGSSNIATIVSIVEGAVIGVLVIIFAAWVCLEWARIRRLPLLNTRTYNEDESIETSESPIFFDLSTIAYATNNFSDKNKLGEGGFGQVYKGVLANGEQIAVKRISSNSNEGLKHLKNEVKLLAKLQHKNLVKLFGCCLDGLEQKLLVYEYLRNTSLDKFLFDPEKRPQLDWETRIKIIGGVARGLVYLHEDSRLKIVHRDLKVSNILLDDDMNPKISDFGLAKLFHRDATHESTSRIAGTRGYMAPEYTMRGAISTKSDVYSYGILVLEILTGKNVLSTPGENQEDLLTYVWRHWKQGEPLRAIDNTVIGPSPPPNQELIRCMHIALLCVQDDPSERPDMATVILMLRSQSMSLSAPSAPSYYPGASTTGTGTGAELSLRDIQMAQMRTSL